jgi:transposase
MSTTKVVLVPLTLPERHKFVALEVKAGKSNRAIAKELGVDEGTVRRDRKFLETPESERPVRAPRAKKQKEPKKEKLVRELTPEERRQQHWQLMLTVVNLWITQEGLILPDLELYVLPEAGKLLHHHRHFLSQLPESVRSPDELLSLTRPNRAVEDFMPSKLPFYAEWLARWLACCLPRDEELQDEFLRQAIMKVKVRILTAHGRTS